MRESIIFEGEKAPLLFGHRGCPSLAPENTLSSFQKALENNVPGVELDVQICRSGELVVTHDNNMKRTTGFDGEVVAHDLSQIRSLDCGSFFSPQFVGEKIPLLKEVFSLLGNRVYYDIELKADYTKNLGLEQKVLNMIRDYNLEKRVVISSFNPIALKRFSRLNSSIKTFLIYSDDKDVPRYLRRGEGRFLSRPYGLKPDVSLLDDKLYKMRKDKYTIMSWTVDDPQEFKRLSALGVEGICSNRADEIVSGKFVDQ